MTDATKLADTIEQAIADFYPAWERKPDFARFIAARLTPAVPTTEPVAWRYRYKAGDCSVWMNAPAPTDASIELKLELAYAPPVAAPEDVVKDALGSLSLKIAEKISQLRHYRDNDCQLDHARIIAEGRISQAEMDLRWVREAYAALPVKDGAKL